jgi:hypothetical protein
MTAAAEAARPENPTESLIAAWRAIQAAAGDRRGWVLFEHGTCVRLDGPVAEAVGDARTVAAEIVAASAKAPPAANQGISELPDHLGWLVAGGHPAAATFVARHEVEAEPFPAYFVGPLGRSKADADAEGRRIVHVEPAEPARG